MIRATNQRRSVDDGTRIKSLPEINIPLRCMQPHIWDWDWDGIPLKEHMPFGKGSWGNPEGLSFQGHRMSLELILGAEY